MKIVKSEGRYYVLAEGSGDRFHDPEIAFGTWSQFHARKYAAHLTLWGARRTIKKILKNTETERRKNMPIEYVHIEDYPSE